MTTTVEVVEAPAGVIEVATTGVVVVTEQSVGAVTVSESDVVSLPGEPEETVVVATPSTDSVIITTADGVAVVDSVSVDTVEVTTTGPQGPPGPEADLSNYVPISGVLNTTLKWFYADGDTYPFMQVSSDIDGFGSAGFRYGNGGTSQPLNYSYAYDTGSAHALGFATEESPGVFRAYMETGYSSASDYGYVITGVVDTDGAAVSAYSKATGEAGFGFTSLVKGDVGNLYHYLRRNGTVDYDDYTRLTLSGDTYDSAHYAQWNTAYGWGNHAGVYDPAGTAQTLIDDRWGKERMKRLIDDASGTLYIGEAEPGTAESASLWAIKRVEFVGDDVYIKWAESVNTYTNTWDARLTYTYG